MATVACVFERVERSRVLFRKNESLLSSLSLIPSLDTEIDIVFSDGSRINNVLVRGGYQDNNGNAFLVLARFQRTWRRCWFWRSFYLLDDEPAVERIDYIEFE